MKASRIRYVIDESSNLVLGSTKDVIDFEDFDLHMRELVQDPKFYSGINGLYDFSMIKKIRGNPEYFMSISDQITQLPIMEGKAKVAIVTGGSEFLNKVFEGWKVMMSCTQIIYETFDTLEQAKTWLDL